jgi:capsular polysaccharide export protein
MASLASTIRISPPLACNPSLGRSAGMETDPVWPLPPRRAVVHGSGLARVQSLPALLPDWTLLRSAQARRLGADLVLAWGRKPSADSAERWARQQGLPLLRLEDGFMRSVGLGDAEPPLSLVLDDLGIYYDATSASRLERLIAGPISHTECARAEALQQRWRDARVSKYNHARENAALAEPGDVLVVDQTAGDASIVFGLAGAASFGRMLEAALDEHPRARILLKVHPDVVAGRKKGHFGALSAATRQRVTVLSANLHAPSLLERVSATYVVTSQMGFEALLWGCPVRCFGMPFYAGWGLTGDELAPPDRRRPADLPALVHATLVAYPRYLDPESGQLCPPERLLDWMGWQRLQRERFSPEVHALGFVGWKRGLLRRFMAGSQIRFIGQRSALPPASTLVVWGRQALPEAARQEPPRTVVRVEDGFLRSVGLGADLVRPVSWVLDRQGIHYDAGQASALESLLLQTDFTPALRARARQLREGILAAGLTKYNLVGQPWQRPAAALQVVLVIGQVESDAAIRYGAPGLARNAELLQAVRALRPNAWLIYKPHPDVVAGLRQPGLAEDQVAADCDEVLADVAIDQLLSRVDEVHVLSSLAGFEALMRGVRVVTWGCPFYAGWGLTEDRLAQPRRGRQLDLDSLVAAVLILYPTYVSRRTGHFTTPEHALVELQQWRVLSSKRSLTALGKVGLGLKRWVLSRWVAWRRRN